MISKALLARFESHSHRDDEIERFLRDAQPAVEREPATLAWFGIRFGRGEYGIFDAFSDEAGRDAHLQGEVAHALIGARESLLSGEPAIQPIDVLAHKLPVADMGEITKGLLLTFRAKPGHEAEVATFLRGARRFVDEEAGTRAWFALQIDASHYGIFDVFPDNGARFAHLAGHIPRELAKHALTLLGGMPDISMLDIVCASPPKSVN